MGPGIVVPLVALVIIVPVVLLWARRRLQSSVGQADEDVVAAPSMRITSNALRTLPAPPWRVVHEVADHKLGGIEHVLIGPPGIYAVRTSMDPLPAEPEHEPTAQQLAAPAIARGELDDVLRRCALASDAMLEVHWGQPDDPDQVSTPLLSGLVAVDGRRLLDWTATLDDVRLTASQIDLAWQTVTTAIGRPDPLA